ncbi:hypothetical protein EDF36_3326 [Rathayibacter sp. PhB152]|uniref:hypothetical protein n=1 Tax=unclassified Rathayibacter TaxID=2609250 RepID=UPI000F4C3962|nr:MULTISPECIES: hypothetical protein [unclassified Rathayibacter]ROQ54856.1 hypothetical protein EDF36_3326 [Rathayibacter sp. PhB152]ROS28971.1 hypothetical protein EDF22_0705 [Rathayibacter sp. PhB127]TDX80609.1 hypothetical protein EDF35_0262 [Rathayibacter sp. PhB151]
MLAVIVQRIFADARSVFRDDGDVLSSLLGSPMTVVFPLLVTLVGSLPLARDVARRGVVNERQRLSYATLISSKFVAAGLLSSVVFFLYGLAATLIASVAWPLLGHPGVDASVYSNVTPFEQRTTFADLSGGSVLVFGLLMSLWFAFAAAVYSVLTSASLVLVPNRAVALLLPFALYLGMTVVLSVLHRPALTPMFSVFPAGLQQSPWPIAASPTILTALGAAALWVFILRRPSESRHLL